ncbi:hypothetical protein L207DRAFT_521352 [Hyaloscypha variabilis F]|uniref:C2H2 type master regulator of conidiophore development brlA n=1 Tax=Hyaloscypha variabilis (strain UAMH 11265 / GT02V1 / F) TaxID=1149755 RepID=A0A2J6QRE3_HYAVF|nr:hypothetical protein L207DRAFT_521352 [Hyaloscypha variabilis F]
MNMGFGADIHSASSSFSSDSSINSTFSPDGSDWDSSSAVDTPVHTPTRTNFDLVKLEDLSMRDSTPSRNSKRKGANMGFCNMNSITRDVLSGFSDPSMIFAADGKLLSDQAMMGYNNFATYIGPTPNSFSNASCISLDTHYPFDGDLFSPISDLDQSPTQDYVNPSQTTFMETFDFNSPMRSAKSTHFNISYDAPISDYDSGLGHFIPTYHDFKSCSTTPSRHSSLRQSVLETRPTAAALQQIQEEATPTKQAPRQVNTAKKAYKNKLRAQRDTHLPNVERIQQATHRCEWPGCSKKFLRQEHLKRHRDTHTGTQVHPCEFCNKPFSRPDNLKSHVFLHFQPPKKSSRTKYFARAQQVYESMGRKPSTKTEKIKREDDKGLQTRSRAMASGY